MSILPVLKKIGDETASFVTLDQQDVRRALETVWLRNTALQRTSPTRTAADPIIRTMPFSHVRRSRESHWLKPYNVAGSSDEACSNIGYLHKGPKGKIKISEKLKICFTFLPA